MKTEEEYEKKLGELCREELVWVEEKYEMDKMDPWLNGYRNALRTVLQEANRRGERMNNEEKDKVFKVESKLAAGWLELSRLISAFDKEGIEVQDLKKGKARIQEGLETIIVSLK